MDGFNKWRSSLLVLVVAAVPAGVAFGQARTGRDVYEEQLRVRLDRQAPEAREMGFEAGGWFSAAYFNYDDPSTPSGSVRTLRKFEVQPWARVNLRGVHKFYFRGVVSYDDWNSGDNSKERGDDRDERLGRAWYQFDLGRMLRNETGRDPPVGFRAKIGRAFSTIGTALVLSMPLDMIQVDLTTRDWEFMTFVGHSVPYVRNIDTSLAVAGRQDRWFFGAQATYKGFNHHRPFVYFLNNQDDTRPDPWTATQSYEYTSRYLGGGSQGTLVSPNLRYQAEIVGEWGQTYSSGVASGTTGRDHIEAMAVDVLLEYLFPVRTRPKVSVEYIYGSGDQNRTGSSTNTVGGNRADSTDHAFNAFGFRDTGVAFAPRISNIHIYKGGASLRPLEKLAVFKRMEVGTNLFFYHRAASEGAISDATIAAANNARWLGWEWDLYCNWRLTSDLHWTIRYGAFFPGSAYDGGDKTCRQMIYTGIVFSF